MPSVTTLYADASDAKVSRTTLTSWADAREGTALAFTSNTFLDNAVHSTKTPVRGAGIYYSIARSFFQFDISGINHVPKTAQIGFRGYSLGGADIAVVKGSTATIGPSSYDDIEGWVNTGSDGAGGGTNLSNVTFYADEVTTWSTSGYNNIDLNQQGLVDIAGLDTLNVVLLTFDYDLRDIEPPTFGVVKTGLYYADYAGTTRDPRIKLTTQDDAVFFGANF